MCPYCKQDHEKNIADAIALLEKRYGISSDSTNADGRRIVLMDGTVLRLHNTCCGCDEIRIQNFVKQRQMEDELDVKYLE